MAWRIGHLCTHQIDQAKEETKTLAWTILLGVNYVSAGPHHPTKADFLLDLLDQLRSLKTTLDKQ